MSATDTIIQMLTENFEDMDDIYDEEEMANILLRLRENNVGAVIDYVGAMLMPEEIMGDASYGNTAVAMMRYGLNGVNWAYVRTWLERKFEERAAFTTEESEDSE